ncbi:MAG: hypothetical protein PHS44_07710 [Candidatus Dojkabacteria bacterium]|nr:hypothetical protein [Candidatus Dojkabacteria bacterium]
MEKQEKMGDIKSRQNPVMIVVAIVLVLIFIGLVAYVSYQLGKDTGKSEKSDSDTITTATESTSSTVTSSTTESTSSTVTSKTSDTADPYEGWKTCSSKNLKVSLKIPSSFSCETEEVDTLNGTIAISSDTYDIRISNLGRGPYCGDTPDSQEDCRTEIFYSSELIGLSTYYWKDERKEIYGATKVAPSGTWFSIEYDDIETRELTNLESKEIRKILDSVELG